MDEGIWEGFYTKFLDFLVVIRGVDAVIARGIETGKRDWDFLMTGGSLTPY